MPSGERARRSAGGFTYIGLLAVVVVIGILLSAAGEVAAMAAQRERETQLLWVGRQYRAAIGRYWRQKRVYPQALEDLLGTEPDSPLKVRYIRRLYRDPMTNAVDWELVPAPNGGIMGIASSSKRAPLKTHFDEVEPDFENASSYSDWKFTFFIRRGPPPRAPSPAGTAGQTPTQSSPPSNPDSSPSRRRPR